MTNSNVAVFMLDLPFGIWIRRLEFGVVVSNLDSPFWLLDSSYFEFGFAVDTIRPPCYAHCQFEEELLFKSYKIFFFRGGGAVCEKNSWGGSLFEF